MIKGVSLRSTRSPSLCCFCTHSSSSSSCAPILLPFDPSLLCLPASSQQGAKDMAGDHGNVYIVNSKQAWEAKVDDAKTHGKIIVVDFTATWCAPCRLMSPIFTELSKKYDQLIFLKVDVDEVQEVTTEWEIRAMPTFLFIKDGKQLDKIVGANKDELEKKCHHYATNQS